MGRGGSSQGLSHLGRVAKQKATALCQRRTMFKVLHATTHTLPNLVYHTALGSWLEWKTVVADWKVLAPVVDSAEFLAGVIGCVGSLGSV